MNDDALRSVVTGYTREAGVRNLERKISALCRHVAVLVAEQLPEPLIISAEEPATDNENESVKEAKKSAQVPIFEDAATLLEGIEPTLVDRSFIESVLGPVAFESEAKLRVTKPGVATGMAWTQVGGELLFIEATQMPGSGRLILTGKLGDVMRESCMAALSWLKSNVGTLFAPLLSSRRRVEYKEQP